MDFSMNMENNEVQLKNIYFAEMQQGKKVFGPPCL